MTNAIRADIYRLFRAKGFWITQLLLILLVTASVFMKAKNTLGVGYYQGLWNGAETLFNLSDLSFILVYLLLSLFVITIGYDLSQKVLRNLLSSGVSRVQFFFTKYLIFNVVALVQFVFYYGFGFITASLINGIGNFPADYWGRFFAGFAMQILFTQAEFSIGIVVLYLTRRTVWAVLALIFVPYVLGIIVVQQADWLRFAVFQDAIAFAHFMPHADIPIYIAVSSATILLLVGLALFRFQRQDL